MKRRNGVGGTSIRKDHVIKVTERRWEKKINEELQKTEKKNVIAEVNLRQDKWSCTWVMCMKLSTVHFIFMQYP